MKIKSHLFVLLTACCLLLTTACFSQQCNILYVTPNGATNGAAGTKTNPASFTYALSLVTASDSRIYMASGTYMISNPITMISDVSVEGGFNSVTWKKSNAGATVILRDLQNVEFTPERLVAIYCVNLVNFRLQDLTIRVVDAFSSGISTYALYLNGCSNYEIVRCKIIAGNGGNGSNGSTGSDGMDGANGYAGLNGDETGACCTAGGPGACCSFAGSNAGGAGGKGGDRGWYDPPIDGGAYNGDPGIQGSGLGGGVPGGGGLKIITTIYPISCARTTPNDGAAGADGADGLPGGPGIKGASFFALGFFFPGDGLPGTDGTDGAGGGGGGGGGSIGGIIHDWPFNGWPSNQNGSGAGGGGGGEGGQHASGGNGGNGGGSSFALFLVNNGTGGFMRDCFLKSGTAGMGGTGGTGGSGGDGGTGGAGGGKYNCNVGAGGDGGRGGSGGEGGEGGDGAAGVSYQLYEDASGTPIAQYNIYNLQQPAMSVAYTGCTDAPVIFSTPSSGTVEWYFGAGAVPSYSVGNPAIARYITTGLKTFTMIVNGIPYTFTTFIDIFSSGAGLNPAIQATDTAICRGDAITFTSSVTAANYSWIIKGENIADTISGLANQTLSNYTFDSAGTYEITLFTTSSCCGISFSDTFNVSVDEITPPSVTIQASDSTALCEDETVIFSASGYNAGTSPSYVWMLNGAIAGTNSPTFASSNIDSGDVVQCFIVSSMGCSAGLIDSSNSITIIEVTTPTVICSADSFEAGQPTFFTAGVTSGGMMPFTYTWNFGDSTIGFGDSVAHIYNKQGSYIIQVDVVDANGCGSNCNTIATIFSSLSAKFNADNITGCAPLTVNFSNQSTNAITYLWNFGDGSTSAVKNPVHTYSNPGSYTVSLIANGGSGTAAYTMPSQVFVYPNPVANFQAYPQSIFKGGDTVFFADNSYAATTWLWNFGDTASGAQNTSTLQNPFHYYSTDGNYTVTLIVSNEYKCADTTVKQNFVSINVGMEEVRASGFGFRVFPNPVRDVVFFRIESAQENVGSCSVVIFDAMGRKVKVVSVTGNTVAINCKEIERGIYFYKMIINNQFSAIGKIMVD